MTLSESQDRLLRRISYRREWGSNVGVTTCRMSAGEQKTALALYKLGLARRIADGPKNAEGNRYWRYVSTRKGEVQIELENDRIARLVRRARKR